MNCQLLIQQYWGTAAEADTLFASGVAPASGLLMQVIQHAGGLNQTTTYSQFDAAGNPGTVICPGCCGSGQVTHYTYDTLGRVRTKENALGVVAIYDYDAAGHLTQRTEHDPASGRTVTQSTPTLRTASNSASAPPLTASSRRRAVPTTSTANVPARPTLTATPQPTATMMQTSCTP